MARDPFGNELPDPFGGSGGYPPLPPPPGPDATVGGGGGPGPGTGSPFPPLPPRPGPGRQRRVVVVHGLLGWVFALVVLGAVGFGAWSVFDRVDDGIDDTRRAIRTTIESIRTAPAPGTTPGAALPGREAPGVPAPPPTGFGKGSLLLKSNFADALRLLQAEGSQVRLLRVAPDRIDASIVGGGQLKQVQVTWQGRVSVSSTTPSGSSDGLLALDAIVRAAPFRLVRSAAERAGRSPASVDYVVALALADPWRAFFKDGGGSFAADRRGRITQRIG